MALAKTLALTLIADYGEGDLAFAEVKQRLRKDLPHTCIDTLSVPAFDTAALGFCLAQLALNDGSEGGVYYHNCAPRKDDTSSRADNDGEGLTFLSLPNDTKVIGVNSGYSLSFLKKQALLIKEINVPTNGSQFRSRDIFPTALAQLVKGDYSLLSAEIPLDEIPDPPLNRILWIDGYGNMKTSIPLHSLNLEPGSEVFIRVGKTVHKAVFADGSFSVPEGVLAFAPGSSGWLNTAEQHQIRWMELFLRGGSAWKLFNCPETGSPINYLQSWESVFSGYQDSFSWSV